MHGARSPIVGKCSRRLINGMFFLHHTALPRAVSFFPGCPWWGGRDDPWDRLAPAHPEADGLGIDRARHGVRRIEALQQNVRVAQVELDLVCLAMYRYSRTADPPRP